MSKISIVVPVYNAEKYIRACVESIINQSYDDFELILVDDGSIDASLDACMKLAEVDLRIKVYTKANGGVSSARNFGISKATGKYITFIDSDDFVSENYCAALLEKMTSDIGMVVMGLQKVHPDGTVNPITHRFAAGKYPFNELVAKIIDDGTLSGFSIHSSCAVLYDLETIKTKNIEFNENIRYNEDGLFNTEYYLKSERSAYIDYSNYIYFYRSNSASATSTVDLFGEKYRTSMDCIQKVLRGYEDRFPDIPGQMILREATNALNKLIFLAQKEHLNAKITKEILTEKAIKEGFDRVDYSAMSTGKKTLCYAIKYRAYWLITKVLKTRFKING